MYLSLQKNSDVAVYEQIVQAICLGIRQGRLVPGDQVDTEQALSAHLKISRTTVNRAYEKLRIIGVLASTRGRGSVISQNALKTLGVQAQRPMRKIAFVVSAIGQMSQIPWRNRHQVYDALEGVNRRLETAHAMLSYICIGRGESQGKPDKRELDELSYQLRDFDGLILLAQPQLHGLIIPVIEELKIPCVSLYTPFENPGIAHVIYDRIGAVHLAVDHLVSKGYQSIGYIGTDDRAEDEKRSKYTAFHEAIARHHLSLDQNHVWLIKNFDARNTVKECLVGRASRPPCGVAANLKRTSFSAQRTAGGTLALPQAFFVTSDFYAMGALSAFQAGGIHIPEDLGIMSYDDVGEFSLSHPALSTIHVPREDIGYQAADMLFNWPIDGAAPKSKVLQPKLVVRDSCPGMLEMAA